MGQVGSKMHERVNFRHHGIKRPPPLQAQLCEMHVCIAELLDKPFDLKRALQGGKQTVAVNALVKSKPFTHSIQHMSQQVA